ncbi:MAG: hypothetical protein ABL876_01500 [Chitinophagaceae bacterium]
MKTFPLNLIRKFLPLILFFSFGTVHAQDSLKTDDRSSIQYSGVENDHFVFYVKVDNLQKEKMNCVLTDENRNVLFEESFSAQKFEKKFLVPKENVKDLTFRINGKKYHYNRNFSFITRIIEEVTVKEIK